MPAAPAATAAGRGAKIDGLLQLEIVKIGHDDAVWVSLWGKLVRGGRDGQGCPTSE
jgi:hypothetical protein